MGNTWTPGERADAHHVASVLRAKFARDEKVSSREFVADYFRSVGAASVLDLWGGGESALALRAALPEARIVSIENGSVCGTDWFTDKLGRPVSRARLQRAHQVSADEGGYEALWGEASTALRASYDAVWLDFCAQWHPKMGDLIRLAGASSDHLAVTIMPERDGLGTLGLQDRLIGLTAILAAHADMVPAYVGSYQRNDLGQDMALFVFDRRAASGDGREATIVLPTHILRGLSVRGQWGSKRFSSRKSMILMKCAKCDKSFTYSQSTFASGPTGRKYCPEHSHAAYTSSRRYARGKGWTKAPRVEGSCGHCGEVFVGLETQRWCSRRCGENHRKKVRRQTLPRRHRGKRTPTCHPNRAYKAHGMCSQCYESERYRLERDPHHTCVACGSTFERTQFGQRRYCSPACGRKFYARTHAAYRPKRCLGCGGRQRHPTQLCAQCRASSHVTGGIAA